MTDSNLPVLKISANRQIARAAGTVMAAFIFSQLTGLLRTILVANAFGTNPGLEALASANRVSETISISWRVVRWPRLLSQPLPAC